MTLTKRLEARQVYLLCPACGSNRPTRSLILCRSCYRKLPEHVKREAMTAAEKDRQSIYVGEMAAKVIATCNKMP